MKEHKILLVSPSFRLEGGVVEFNKMLLKYGSANYLLFEISSGLQTNKLLKFFCLIWDYVRFLGQLLLNNIDVVHINPSLGANAIKRDGIFVKLAKVLNKQVYVHWHGWNPENEHLLEGDNLKFIKNTFFKADHIKFLSEGFKKKFDELGYRNQLSVGSTFVDDELVKNLPERNFNKEAITLLFLSTISTNKGIYVALNTFKELQKTHPELNLVIAGDGAELENTKAMVNNENIPNVSFTGFVSGAEKRDVFLKADIYLFPSFYEGMPTSVLEAMCFGLPIVCSNVGAIPEIFEEGKMGHIILKKNDVYQYKEAIANIIGNKVILEEMSVYNNDLGKKCYLASKIVERIENDYLNLVK